MDGANVKVYLIVVCVCMCIWIFACGTLYAVCFYDVFCMSSTPHQARRIQNARERPSGTRSMPVQ